MDRKYRGVSARGNRIQIAFTFKGERCREVWPKEPTEKNLKEAHQFRETILTQIKLGVFDYERTFPNSAKAQQMSPNRGDKITIEDALNQWLRVHKKRIARSTERDYASALREHLIPTFGHLSLTELKASDIRKWIASLTISNKRINNVLVPLRAVYNEALEDEIVAKSPLTGIKNLKVVTREPNPFNEREIEAILNELRGNDRNLIQFAFETGLRTSELIALRWEDIDLRRRQIYVRRAIVRGAVKETKTKAGTRSVELNEVAFQALENQAKLKRDDVPEVFFDSSCPHLLDDQKIRKRIWKPALSKANIEYREPYQTRHTFASVQLSSGKPAIWVAYQMGHSNPNYNRCV